MRLGVSQFRFWGGVCLLPGLILPLRAATDSAESSPFLPPAVAGAPAMATPGAPIELRGVMTTPEGLLFSIYDPTKKSAAWLGLNETGHNYVVRQHQLVGGNDQVTVDYMGSSLTLSLKAAKIALGQPTNFFPPGGGSQPNPSLTQSVVLNPTPADQAARLQAVAEEVQRRRALRQQRGPAMRGQMNGQQGAPASPR